MSTPTIEIHLLSPEAVAGIARAFAATDDTTATDTAAAPNPPAYFTFGLRQRVRLTESGEEGIIIARMDDAEAVSKYHIRYRAADGRQVEDWWSEATLEPV